MRAQMRAMACLLALALVVAAPAAAPAMMQVTGTVGATLIGLPDLKVDMTGMDPGQGGVSVGTGMVFSQAGNYVIPMGQTDEHDLYLWAQMLDLEGTLDGDLIAWVQNGRIEGTVTEDVTMFAQDLRISGEVGDDIRVFCQNLWIDGTVKGDVLGFGANITVSEGAVIEGNVLTAGGVVLMNGDILGDARIASGTANIAGTIGGNAEIKTDGGLTFGPDASIGGDLSYQGPAETTPPPGVVAGSVTYSKPAPEVKPNIHFPEGLGVIWWIVRFLMALVAGSIIIALTKEHAHKTADTIRRKPLKSLGIGFIALICVPIIAVIGMVLVLPFMMSVVLSLAYAIALYISKFYVSIWVGNMILRRGGRTDVSPVPAMLLGLLIVYLITAIPVAGTLIGIVIIPSLGIGALLQRRETRLNGAFEAPAPSPEGLPAFPGASQPTTPPAPPASEV